jgi:hypothetical protein
MNSIDTSVVSTGDDKSNEENLQRTVYSLKMELYYLKEKLREKDEEKIESVSIGNLLKEKNDLEHRVHTLELENMDLRNGTTRKGEKDDEKNDADKLPTGPTGADLSDSAMNSDDDDLLPSFARADNTRTSFEKLAATDAVYIKDLESKLSALTTSHGDMSSRFQSIIAKNSDYAKELHKKDETILSLSSELSSQRVKIEDLSLQVKELTANNNNEALGNPTGAVEARDMIVSSPIDSIPSPKLYGSQPPTPIGSAVKEKRHSFVISAGGDIPHNTMNIQEVGPTGADLSDSAMNSDDDDILPSFARSGDISVPSPISLKESIKGSDSEDVSPDKSFLIAESQLRQQKQEIDFLRQELSINKKEMGRQAKKFNRTIQNAQEIVLLEAEQIAKLETELDAVTTECMSLKKKNDDHVVEINDLIKERQALQAAIVEKESSAVQNALDALNTPLPSKTLSRLSGDTNTVSSRKGHRSAIIPSSLTYKDMHDLEEADMTALSAESNVHILDTFGEPTEEHKWGLNTTDNTLAASTTEAGLNDLADSSIGELSEHVTLEEAKQREDELLSALEGVLAEYNALEKRTGQQRRRLVHSGKIGTKPVGGSAVKTPKRPFR